MISWKSQDGDDDRGRPDQAGRLRPDEEVPAAVRHPRRPDRHRPADAARRTRYYPVDTWAGRGALVLKVNYRGSAGYGEKFRQLNVRNLGVGDAWDVLSGVDHLIAKGWVDPAKVGCMGWSQGGYISAFLTTSSTASRRSRSAPASRTGRPTTTTPTSRRSRSSISATIRPPTRRSTGRRRR